jgi:hypothetical protein
VQEEISEKERTSNVVVVALRERALARPARVVASRE